MTQQAKQSGKQTKYSDKPYFFAPLAEKIVSDRRPRNKALQAPLLSGKLAVTLKAVTPLHFGQCQLMTDLMNDRTNPTAIHVLCREGGCPVLPGSSFKGSLRSVFEAVTNSCILFYPCKVEFATPFENRSACRPIRDEDRVCPACSVFGNLGGKGKLTFSSFRASGNVKTGYYKIPQLQAPFRDYPRNEQNRGLGNERLYYGNFIDVHGIEVGDMDKAVFLERKRTERGRAPRFYGRKLYKHAQKPEEGNDAVSGQYECLRPGTELSGTIAYEGLARDELAALLFSMGLGWKKKIYHKAGYAKPAYFGSVEIAVSQIKAPDRYERFGLLASSKPLDSQEKLESLAKEHLTAAGHYIRDAVAAIEKEWSVENIGKSSQWKRIEGNITY
jgi:hypothetical protein